jgi:putative ABC transport system permease protein
MIIISMIQSAVMALATNKLRTVLTMLGIVIGVGAVIALMAAGQGAKQGVTKEVSGLGSNLIFIQSQNNTSSSSSSSRSTRSFNPFSLTTADAAALQNNPQLPYVSAVVAQYGLTLSTQITGNGRTATATSMTATQPDYTSVRDWKVAAGGFITDQDMTTKATNVVLGAQVAQDLFDTPANAIGQNVRLSFGPFSLDLTVEGVMGARGAAGTGTDDTTIIVPLTTFQERVPFGRSPTGQSNIQEIIVKVTSSDKVDQTKTAINDVILNRHQTQDFVVQTQSDLTSAARNVSKTLTILLGAIAGISLVVGGIGTMNIMLVSVTERTREIGIRKAVGANRQDILLQFVIEALVVTIVGGAVGVVVGVLAARIANGQSFGTSSAVTTLVTPFSIFVAFGVSVAIGLFFGIYPAFRASRLDPIEALRTE